MELILFLSDDDHFSAGEAGGQAQAILPGAELGNVDGGVSLVSVDELPLVDVDFPPDLDHLIVACCRNHALVLGVSPVHRPARTLVSARERWLR